jgi:3-dehydroquinate dehydratase II
MTIVAAKNIWLINGPNLNRLGSREPHIYGSQTLAELETQLHNHAQPLNVTLTCRQSNHEGALIDWLHEADNKSQGIILNAGAYTHSSIALHDAIKAIQVPVIEVHLSNPHAREAFRHHSYIAPVASGVIYGFGTKGYVMALEALALM